MKPTKYIWKNNKLILWEEATTHVLTHALHYGTGVFEGIRAYETPKGPAIFKAQAHYQRLLDSAAIYQMPMEYSVSQLIEANKQVIKENKLSSCYIRPLSYRGYGVMGLNPQKAPVDTIIAAWEWGTYLGEEGLKKGIRCKMSSWARIDARTLPPIAKCTANYANSVLAKAEAIDCGYDEAIMLNLNGTIAEGPGENLFMVKDGDLITTPVADGVLYGITAQSVVQIAQDMGINVVFRSISREELFIADELFFTGTAAEVTPIREIDGRMIKSNGRGPITEKVQSKYFDVVQGKDKKYEKWLCYV
ncbi:branched-chain amino acid transaminase [Candidatus Margulisiibacteriota bacterium]